MSGDPLTLLLHPMHRPLDDLVASGKTHGTKMIKILSRISRRLNAAQVLREVPSIGPALKLRA